jgi:hypothetical protein
MTLLTGCDDETLCLCGKDAVVVTPNKNDNPLNGVSTYDLVLISRHISLEPCDLSIMCGCQPKRFRDHSTSSRSETHPRHLSGLPEQYSAVRQKRMFSQIRQLSTRLFLKKIPYAIDPPARLALWPSKPAM